MRNSKRSIALALGLGLTATVLSAGTTAAAIGGKKNLVCAASEVVGCTEAGCLQGSPKTFDLMTFIFVDVERKLVHGTNTEGKEVSSPVKNLDVTENAVVMQGIENHAGWTMGLDRADGSMSLSLTSSDVNFMISGNCTER